MLSLDLDYTLENNFDLCYYNNDKMRDVDIISS